MDHFNGPRSANQSDDRSEFIGCAVDTGVKISPVDRWLVAGQGRRMPRKTIPILAIRHGDGHWVRSAQSSSGSLGTMAIGFARRNRIGFVPSGCRMLALLGAMAVGFARRDRIGFVSSGCRMLALLGVMVIGFARRNRHWVRSAQSSLGSVSSMGIGFARHEWPWVRSARSALSSLNAVDRESKARLRTDRIVNELQGEDRSPRRPCSEKDEDNPHPTTDHRDRTVRERAGRSSRQTGRLSLPNTIRSAQDSDTGVTLDSGDSVWSRV